MFTANLTSAVLETLLGGTLVEVFYSPPGDSCQDEESGFEIVPERLPEDGDQWMTLNERKLFVRVTSACSPEDECPCCRWFSVSFQLID